MNTPSHLVRTFAALALALGGILLAPLRAAADGDAPSSVSFVLRELYVMRGHDSLVSDVLHSPDGAIAISCSTDGTIIGWDGESGARLWSSRESAGACGRVAFSQDGSFAAIAGRSFLGLIEPRTGAWLRRFPAATPVVYTAVAVAPDQRKVAVGGNDARIRIVALATGEETTLAGHEWPILDMQFTTDAQSLLAGDATSIRLWDVDSGVERRRLVDTSVGDVPGLFWMGRLAFSPDGRHVVASSGNDAVLFNLATLQLTQRFVGHEKEVVGARVSADLRHVLTSGRDHSIRYWDVETGREVSATAVLDFSFPAAVSVSPRGDRFVLGGASIDFFGGVIGSRLSAWAIEGIR